MLLIDMWHSPDSRRVSLRRRHLILTALRIGEDVR